MEGEGVLFQGFAFSMKVHLGCRGENFRSIKGGGFRGLGSRV
jgi:hypothetical protein